MSSTKTTAAKAATSKAATAKASEAKAKAKAAPAEQEEEEPAEQSHLLSRGLVWASTSWGLSMILHIVFVLVLGMWTIAQIAKTEVKDLVATVEERPDEVINQVLEEEVKPSETLDLVSTSISSMLGANGAVQAMAEPKVAQQVTETVTDQPQVDVALADVFASTGTVLSNELPEGQAGDPAVISDSIADAMDRITAEILAKLAKSKVLVIWCFDESGSVQDDRIEIMNRIERVYKELGVSEQAAGDALLTAVTSYSMATHVQTPKPTANIEEIMKAMNDVPIDESGVENMCQAIGESISLHRKYATSGRRQLMLILVTDESGDPKSNFDYLEATIAEAKQGHCPLYVLGREAVFGYPYAHMRWEDPKTGIPFWIQIDRGPETPFPEQLQIDGLHRRWDAHASGFGPYEQTRMARQTGGLFFMLPNPEANLVGRDNRKYTLEAMRPYLPDLSARADYLAERDKHEMRRIMWKVITDLNPYNKGGPRVEVRIDNFSINQDEFRRQAAEEMKQAMALIGYLKEAEKALEKARPMRSREASPRWRANFDMMYAQTIAYQVRLYEYGAYLQAFMNNPKPIKNVFGPRRPTNAWDVHTSAKTLTGDKFKKEKDKSTQLYTEIMREHVGTPYASRAEWEIKRGFGVDLHEDYEDPRRAGIKVPKL